MDINDSLDFALDGHSKQQQRSVQQSNVDLNGDGPQNNEPQLNNTSDHHTELQTNAEKMLQEARTRELDLLSRVEELEIEIKLKKVDAQLTRSKQFQKTLQELKEAYGKIGHMHRTQRALHEQINVLKAILKTPSGISMSKESSTVESQTVELKAERDEVREREKQDLEQRLNDLSNSNAALNDQLAAEKENNTKSMAEITLIKQEKDRIESEFAALQKENQTISEEKNKICDEMIEIRSKLEQRDDEVEKLGDELKAKEALLSDFKNKEDRIRKSAKKYKESFVDLQNKYEALTTEKPKEEASSQTEPPSEDSIGETEYETLSKRLSELNDTHAIALNIIQTLTKEKENLMSELTATKTTQAETGMKSLIDQANATAAESSKGPKNEPVTVTTQQKTEEKSTLTKRRHMDENESNATSHDEDTDNNTLPAKRRLIETEKSVQFETCRSSSDASSNNETIFCADDHPFSASRQSAIDSSAKLIVASNGKIGTNELYRCAFPGCNWMKSNEYEFTVHLFQHDFSGNYHCYHCQERFDMAFHLKKHMKTHQKCRFFCYHCEHMSVTQQEMEKHFADIHLCVPKLLPLNPNSYDTSSDLFVVCPAEANLDPFFKRLMKRAYDLQVKKRKFHPHEIESLPKQPIFHEKLECALCGFCSLVRRNLIRHFENGCNEQQAPIDQIDDTDNSTASTNANSITAENDAAAVAATAAEVTVTSDQNLGKFVPEVNRNRCFARSCDYRTFSPYMLQQHIETSHGMENAFSCPHCGEDLGAKSTAKEVLNHLRYHGSRIYRCPGCAFIHYSKPQCDKHIDEMHPNAREEAITLDRPVMEDESANVELKKAAVVEYKCNRCSASFGTHALIKSHLNAKHCSTNEFNCSICQYSHDSKSNVLRHLHTTHQHLHTTHSDCSKVKSNYERIVIEL